MQFQFVKSRFHLAKNIQATIIIQAVQVTDHNSPQTKRPKTK